MALREESSLDEGYWKDFLVEFYERQREQAAERSGFSKVFEMAKSWVTSLGVSKWAYGVGLAYAAITVIYLLTPNEVEIENMTVAPIRREVAPKLLAHPSKQLNKLDFSPTANGLSGEQVF